MQNKAETARGAHREDSAEKRIGAVIVSAGLSSRMRDFKPLLPVAGHSSVKQIIQTFRQAGVGTIVVVTGYRGNELEAHLRDQDVICLRNTDYRTSQMFDSARIGFSCLVNRCDYVLFTPVDVPLFQAKTVRLLLQTQAQVAKPSCRGKGGHPICLSKDALSAVLSDDGEGGLKGALARSNLKTVYVSVRDEGMLMDMDTPDDYQRILALVSQGFRVSRSLD